VLVGNTDVALAGCGIARLHADPDVTGLAREQTRSGRIAYRCGALVFAEQVIGKTHVALASRLIALELAVDGRLPGAEVVAATHGHYVNALERAGQALHVVADAAVHDAAQRAIDGREPRALRPTAVRGVFVNAFVDTGIAFHDDAKPGAFVASGRTVDWREPIALGRATM
jgi:hypothetical protein